VLFVALAAFIFIYQHYFRPVVAGPATILHNLRPAEVTGIEVIPLGALEIRADRTNEAWFLTSPIYYPAQTAAIESLLDALQKLTSVIPISAADLREHRQAGTEYGFDNPQYKIVIEQDDQRWQLQVGNKTAPGDQVYLSVVGVEGAYVADAGWLHLIPQTADVWRNTALVDANSVFDWIVLTNHTREIAIELRRNPTNYLWSMTRPLPARADTDRITLALQRLRDAHVTQFINDDPKADMAAYGLQPADFDLWLGTGTNLNTAIHAGKSPTNDATQIYAKREGWNAIFITALEPLMPWRGTVNSFRDPRLFELTSPAAEIEVHSSDHFILQRHGSNDWRIVGEKFPADAENVQAFIKYLAGLRIAEFVKDVVTGPDLETYGLAKPSRQITLRSSAGNTNAVIADVLFGATVTNEVYAKLANEGCVFGLATSDMTRMPEFDYSWEFRDRHVWDFNESEVTQITLHQNGKTRVMVRNGVNQWSLAAHSQGIINPPALEETTHRFGQLTAYYWLGRNIADPEKTYGLNTNNLQVTFELKTGDKYTVDFGTELPQMHTALAVVNLEGERWGFVFSPVLYQFVLSYLTIPANVP